LSFLCWLCLAKCANISSARVRLELIKGRYINEVASVNPPTHFDDPGRRGVVALAIMDTGRCRGARGIAYRMRATNYSHKPGIPSSSTSLNPS